MVLSDGGHSKDSTSSDEASSGAILKVLLAGDNRTIQHFKKNKNDVFSTGEAF